MTTNAISLDESRRHYNRLKKKSFKCVLCDKDF